MNIGLFVDVNNLHYCVSMKYTGAKLDYSKYLKCIENEFGPLRWKIAYGTQKNDEATKFINYLKYLNFDVKYLTLTKNRIITTRVDFVLDIIRVIPKLDVAILGINNHDYIPLIEYIKNQGVKCGIFAARISKELREHCDFVTEINRDLLINQTDTLPQEILTGEESEDVNSNTTK